MDFNQTKSSSLSLELICFLLCAVLLKCAKTEDIGSFQVPDYEMIKTSLEGLPDTRCTQDLDRYITSLEAHEKWAMTMFDATVKFPFGLLHGNSYQLGNYDECVEVVAPKTISEHNSNATDGESFVGQYCLAQIRINVPKMMENLSEAEQFQHASI